jgi:hypothetical protein
MVDLYYSFDDWFTLLFEVPYFVGVIYRWLTWLSETGFGFGDNLFSLSLYVASSFSGPTRFIPRKLLVANAVLSLLYQQFHSSMCAAGHQTQIPGL